MLASERSLSMDWAVRLACLAIVLLAAALRLKQLGTDSLWFDEIWQVSLAANHTASEIVQVHLRDAQAPLDPLITNAVLYLGRDEYLLRFPAACFSVLTVALSFVLGRAMFGTLEGLITAFLLAVSASHIRYAQEVRTYALLAFLGSLSLWFFWRAVRTDRVPDWLGWTLAGILGLTAMSSAAFWVVAHAVYGLSAAGINHWRRNQVFMVRPGQLKKLLLGTLIVVVGAGVQLALALGDYTQRTQWWGPLGPSVVNRWAQLTRQLLLDLVAGMYGNRLPTTLFCIVAIVCTYAILIPGRKDQPAIYLLSLCCLVPWLLALGLVVRWSAFYVRYLLFVLPPCLLLVARGITAVAEASAAWMEALNGPRVAAAWSVIAFSVAAFGLIAVPPVRAYYRSTKPDWRGVAHYLGEKARRGDVIITDGVSPVGDDEWARTCLSYYFPAGERQILILPVWDVDALEEIRDRPAAVGAVIYHRWVQMTVPQGAEQYDLKPVRFPSVLLLLPNRRDNVLDGALRVLQALLTIQQKSAGEFDVHLSLARVYAMQGEFSLAYEELHAARLLSLQTKPFETALNFTAEYIRERQLQRR